MLIGPDRIGSAAMPRRARVAGLSEHGRGCWPRPPPWRLPSGPPRPRRRIRPAQIALPEIGVNAAPAVDLRLRRPAHHLGHQDRHAAARRAAVASPSSPSELIGDQSMQSMADVVRYVPGVGIAQGEGNRDTPVLRGNSSTADFFVDGVRDDVQYFRDLYNVERVEALQGPQRDDLRPRRRRRRHQPRHQAGGLGRRSREVTLQGGSFGQQARHASTSARPSASTSPSACMRLYEDSDSYRDGVEPRALRHQSDRRLSALGDARPSSALGYEHFHDERTADRGIPSFRTAGRSTTGRATFFGDPDRSHVARAGQRGDDRRSSTSFGDGVLAAQPHALRRLRQVLPERLPRRGRRRPARTVNLQRLQQRDPPQNLFNQTDLIFTLDDRRHPPHAAGRRRARPAEHRQLPQHRLLQRDRRRPRSSPLGATRRSTCRSTFRQSATDADNHGVADVGRRLRAGPDRSCCRTWQAIGGLRFDRFTSTSQQPHRRSASTHRPPGLAARRAWSSSRSSRSRSTPATASHLPQLRRPVLVADA